MAGPHSYIHLETLDSGGDEASSFLHLKVIDHCNRPKCRNMSNKQHPARQRARRCWDILAISLRLRITLMYCMIDMLYIPIHTETETSPPPLVSRAGIYHYYENKKKSANKDSAHNPMHRSGGLVFAISGRTREVKTSLQGVNANKMKSKACQKRRNIEERATYTVQLSSPRR